LTAEATTFCLKLPNKLTYDHIGKVLDQLEPVMKAGAEAHQQEMELDMRSTVFCSPTGITILAACMERLWQEGKFTKGIVLHSKNRLAVQYLKRMDFFRELDIPVKEDFERKEPEGFRPVTHVRGETEAPAVARDLVDAVAERNNLDATTESALKVCFSEVVENVFYHAESPIDALVSIQAYKQKYKKYAGRPARTELVIVDAGKGIRPALAASEYADQVTDDYSAISLAVQKNVSATGDTRRGIGLWVASEVVRRNEGQMLILSNEGGMRVDADGQHRLDDHFWPGTLVAIEFRMDRPIDTKAVYDSEDWPGIDNQDDEPDFDF
jgi:anti-sigma regulatory factor (Ser/Thr protein kinase)